MKKDTNKKDIKIKYVINDMMMKYFVKRSMMTAMNQMESTYFYVPSCMNCIYFDDKENVFESLCKRFKKINGEYELAIQCRREKEKCGIAAKYFISNKT